VNPATERKRIAKTATLGELFDRWKEEKKSELRPRTYETDKSRFETCLAEWSSRTIGSIGVEDVLGLHARLGKKRGRTTANRAVQLLKRLLYFGKVQPNPCSDVELYRETSRARFLQRAELPRLIDAIDAEPDATMKDFFLLALYTGQRRSNVLSMRWADIDLENRLWVVPSDSSKSHQPIDVPLTPPAMEILKRRREAADEDAAFVLPSYGKHGHLTEPKEAWKRICERAKLKDFHIHDLRRTFASYMAMSGASLALVGKSLGHSSTEVTKVYARFAVDAVRESAERGMAAMESAIAEARAKEAGK